MLTGGEDVNTFAIVGEIGPVIAQSRSTDSDGLLSSCGGVRACIPVVVAGGDGEVHPGVDGLVNSVVQGLGLTATQGHIGDGTLMLRPPGGSVLSCGGSELLSSLLSSPQHTGNNITHSPASVGTQDLDGNQVDSLGNTVLARTDGTSAVSAVTITILVDVILGDRLAPRGTTLELNMVDVDAGIDDVHVNTLTAGRVVVVQSESGETELVTVGETRKTLGSSTITNHATRAELRNIPKEQTAECQEREQRSLAQRRQPLASP